MTSAAVRTGNVLPLPARREPARRWADATLDDRADADATGATDDAGAANVADAAGDEPQEAAFDEELIDFDADGAPQSADPAQAGRRQARAPSATASAAVEPADDATMAAWIERIARQDERALEALYDATAARINGVVLRITQRAALAEEVLEDTFWQVWRQAPRFDAARGRPITWLLAMARSRAIDTLRREQRFQHDALPEDDGAEAAELCDGRALPPQDLLEATRGHARVHAALASLEPRSRQLVGLAFFRGLTHEEIATQQQLPLGTVKSLIRRALQQLKRVMEAEHA
ncbi:MAG: sigma-70 family RNA polymerase sigma factor [Burkholderiales bacterium]|nr:sigma-70 family RNA polymerase sigma factor [Burkholderiales bacterium]